MFCLQELLRSVQMFGCIAMDVISTKEHFAQKFLARRLTDYNQTLTEPPTITADREAIASKETEGY